MENAIEPNQRVAYRTASDLVFPILIRGVGSMRKWNIVFTCACLFVTTAPQLAFSQGNGAGLNRGLGKAAANQAAGRAANQAAGQAADAAAASRSVAPSIAGAKNGKGTGAIPAGFPSAAAQKGLGHAGEAMTRSKNLPGFMQAIRSRGSEGSLPREGDTAEAIGRGMSPEDIQLKRFQQAEHLRAISERNGNESLLETADRMESNATRNYERQAGEAEVPQVSESPAPATKSPAKKGFWFRWR